MKTAINDQTGERLYLDPSDQQWYPLTTAINDSTGERLYRHGPSGEWRPMPGAMPAPAGERPSTLRQRSSAALQGATFGFGDELRAGLGAVLDAALLPGVGVQDIPERYRQFVEGERQELEAYREAKPLESLAYEMGGGLVPGIGGAAAMARAMPQAGAYLSSLPATQRLGAATVGGAASGAAGGALTGAGQAETLGDVPAQARAGAHQGALWGMLPAAALEGASTLGQRVGGSVRRHLMPDAPVKADRMVRKALARGSAASPSELRADPTYPAREAMGRVEALGPDTMLADVSEPATAMLDMLAVSPGRTQAAARRQLARRSGRQIDRVTDVLGEGEALQNLERTKQIRQNASIPLYREAFAADVPHTETLQDLFDRPITQQAFRRAKSAFTRVTGRPANHLRRFIVDEAGEEIEVPTLEGWQSIKDKVDDEIGSLYAGGRNKQGNLIVKDLKAPLMEELDEASPLYANARQVWADTRSFEDALESGKRFIRDPSATSIATLEQLSDADRHGYRIGAVQAIQDRLERMGTTHDATKIFRTEAMKRKMRALFTEREYIDFMNSIEALRLQQFTFGNVGTNSKTVQRQMAARDEAWAQEGLNAVVDVVSGMPAQTVARQGLLSRLRNLPINTAPEPARDIAGQVLMEMDPMAIERNLQRIYQPVPRPPTTGAGVAPILMGPTLGIQSQILGNRSSR